VPPLEEEDKVKMVLSIRRMISDDLGLDDSYR